MTQFQVMLNQETRKRLANDLSGIVSTDPATQAAGRRAQAILGCTQYPDSESVHYALAILRGEYDIPECDSGQLTPLEVT